MKCCNGVKNNLGYAYTDWLRFNGVDYKWRKYRYEAGLPFVPLEKDIDLLIAGFNAKYTAFLQLLKEVGCSPLEAYRLTPKNFYLEKQQVSIDKPVKFHNAGEYRMSDRLTAMVTPLVRNGDFDEPVWKASYRQLTNYFYEVRKKTADKLKNPNLMRISLKTFRHWVGTTQYHSTKDILHVQKVLRHKHIESTMVYTHLIDFPEVDEFTSRVAETIEDARELVEKGFDFVCDMNGVKLFRKRK